MSLLEVDDLRTRFYTEEGVVKAVDGLSYRIDDGEKFGIVGESGAGKSVASASLMRLIDSPGRIVGGSIRFTKPETAETFASAFPEHVVDVEELRADHDPVDLVDRLLTSGLSPADIAPDAGLSQGATASSIVAETGLTVRDLVDSRHAADVGLVDENDFVVRDGDDRYIEITRATDQALRRLRGGHISMIFQDPQTALNPVYTVGEQISEAIREHLDYGEAGARERAIQLLDDVGIPDPEARYDDYPHQFSGGMQQRAVIAIALSCDPDLIIADEPTTALDVTIEAQILDLLRDLADEYDTAIQLITHDLAVVATMCDRVMVMYAGQVIEKAPATDLYYDPKHPYTVGLMSSIPRIGEERDRLAAIPGTMPDLVEVPPGCSFHPRCPYAERICTEKQPPLVDVETGADYDEPRPEAHVASCLAYTGDLAGELDFAVSVAGGPPREGFEADGGAPEGEQ